MSFKNLFERSTTYPANILLGDYNRNTQHLKTIFDGVRTYKSSEAQISIIVCREIFNNELGVNYEDMTPLMKYALPECLSYYMQIWEGWNKDVGFEEFKTYLKLKIGFIVAHQEKFLKIGKKGAKGNSEVPYTLVIYGSSNVNEPTRLLNNGDHLKKSEECEWISINLQEFLNFPDASVTVTLPFFKFTRSSTHEHKRYISKNELLSVPPLNVEFINFIKKQDVSCPVTYNIDFIINYFTQFSQAIKSFNRKFKPKKSIKVISEIEIIFKEFTEDLKRFKTEKNLLEIPCEVGFNIAKEFFYLRNKKITNTNSEKSEVINMVEIVIPKVTFSLEPSEQGIDPSYMFIDLDSIQKFSVKKKNSFVKDVNGSIMYSCVACLEKCTGENAFVEITEHFRMKHKGELSVVCRSCNKKFEIHELLETRWNHRCVMVD